MFCDETLRRTGKSLYTKPLYPYVRIFRRTRCP
jgi:hypothetical protein